MKQPDANIPPSTVVRAEPRDDGPAAWNRDYFFGFRAESKHTVQPESQKEKMKCDPKIIESLNKLLAEELTAINQYVVHGEMCNDWGYARLHEKIEQRAIEEMKHAKRLIERILFLDGRPIVSELNPMHIGAEVKQQLENDLESEKTAVSLYNSTIELVVGCQDNGTRELLESILGDEETHVDWLEAQIDQINQMGIQLYLAEQTAS